MLPRCRTWQFHDEATISIILSSLVLFLNIVLIQQTYFYFIDSVVSNSDFVGRRTYSSDGCSHLYSCVEIHFIMRFSIYWVIIKLQSLSILIDRKMNTNVEYLIEARSAAVLDLSVGGM